MRNLPTWFDMKRGVQPAFEFRIMLQLSAPERGLKPATTYAENKKNCSCIAGLCSRRPLRHCAARGISFEDRRQYDDDRILSGSGRSGQGEWCRTSAAAKWPKRHGTARQR